MRFLELVPCARGASKRSDNGPSRHTPKPEPPPPPQAVPAIDLLSGVTTPGSVATTFPGKRRRRVARGAPGSDASPQWRPSLGAISEDGGVRVQASTSITDRKNGRASAAVQAGKAKAAAPAKSHRAERREDYRYFTAPSVFPAFTPVAFLF